MVDWRPVPPAVEVMESSRDFISSQTCAKMTFESSSSKLTLRLAGDLIGFQVSSWVGTRMLLQ